MSFGDEMRAVAQELTEEFSEEIGKTLLIQITDGEYDPVSGTDIGVVTFQESAYMTFTEITEKEVADASFRDAHMKVIVAGADLTVVPVKDNFVLHPTIGKHRIEDVKKDQYKAAYIMYVEKRIAP